MAKISQALADRLFYAIKLIEQTRNWRIFDELVLGITDNKHEKQYDYLRDSMGTRENVLHAGNGWGKTDMFAKKHIYYILKHFLDGEKYKTCQTALTLEQARETKDRIMKMVFESPYLTEQGKIKNGRPDSWFVVNEKNFPLPEIEYCNNAVTHFRTTKNKAQAIEGKEYGYIGSDEVALELHIEHIREKVFLPRLRLWKDSQVDYAATPKGKNAYYRVAEAIKRAGGCVRGGSSFDNPYIDHELLNYIIENWNELKKDQVIYGKFIDNSMMPFAGRVEILFDENLELNDKILDGHYYYNGWDLARGRTTENDMTAGFRIDKTNFEQNRRATVTQYFQFQAPWTEAGRLNYIKEGQDFKFSTEGKIREEYKKVNNMGYIDCTGVGDTLFEMLRDKMHGVDFRGKKEKLIEHAQACIDGEVIKSPFIPQLADQMSTYMYEDKGLDTDALMAFVVAMQGLDIGGNKLLTYDYDEVFNPEKTRKSNVANVKTMIMRKNRESLI